jgi:hypothetical protein
MLVVVPFALALTVFPAGAETIIGIGAFGGIGSPTGDMVDQAQESKSGPHFGFRAPMAFAKMFSLEPYLARTESKADSVYFGTLDGYDVTSFGVNLGFGRLVNRGKHFNIVPFVGAGVHKMRRERGPSDDPFGWKAGLALGFSNSDTWHWNLRGEYNAIGKIEDEGNFTESEGRKYINVSLGITCVVAPR